MTCGVKISNNLKQGRMQAAQLHLNPVGSTQSQLTVGFKATHDTKPWRYSLPIDWNADPYRHHNWKFRLSCWRIMDTFLRDYIADTNTNSLRAAFEIALDWHRAVCIDKTTGKMTWYDMATGIRALRLAFLLDQVALGNVVLSDENAQAFDEMAEAHFHRLSDTTKVAINNHGLFQVFGLEALAAYWKDGCELAAARHFASEHLAKIVDANFTSEGVHKEASPEYHSFVMTSLERAAVGSGIASNLVPILAKARQIEPFLALPDGRYPGIGDTQNEKVNRAFKKLTGEDADCVNGHLTLIKDLYESGYAIARSAPGEAIDREWMLFVTGMAQVLAHKHADDLGFTFYLDGQDIFVDPGKYFYDYSDMRKFIMTAQAHNTVSLEGIDILPEHVDRFDTSALSPMIHDKNGICISGTIHRPGKFWHTRLFDLVPGKSLTIRDLVRSQVPNAVLNRLHVSPGLKLEKDGASVLIHTAKRKIRVSARNETPIEVLSGQKSPLAGWYSPEYGKIVPCSVLQTRHSTDMVDAGWHIDLVARI